jgi:integrase/recombinase XerD
MKLKSLVEKYIKFKKGLGYSFKTNQTVILSFVRAIGYNIELKSITVKQVSKFLNGKGPLTRTWHVKHNALKGLFKYAIRIRCLSKIPMPTTIPKQPPTITPYIYSHHEIKRLLEATNSYQINKSSIDPITVRTIVLLLYAAGLRVSEAISLKINDVHIKERLLNIRNSKCNKSRLVPISKQLTMELIHYLEYRSKIYKDEIDTFFIQRTGKPVNSYTIGNIFQRLRKHAGIFRTDGARYQPRLHDLRHAFAVHRLIAWYQEGEDVTKLLHYLSVYLGHVYLVDTQVYLTITPQILKKANSLFQNYALRGKNEKK